LLGVGVVAIGEAVIAATAGVNKEAVNCSLAVAEYEHYIAEVVGEFV
jgi:hypothetical protein